MSVALGRTVALETTDWVGDTDVRGGRCVISVEVRDRYSPDEGEDCDMGVKGSVLDEREFDVDDCQGIEDDGGDEDIGVDEREGGCRINGSDSINRNVLELKKLGERGLCGGGVSGMGTSRGLALPITVGGIGGGDSQGESRDTTHLLPTDWSLNWRLTTVVDDGTCNNKGERIVGRRDRDDAETDTDTIAGVREGDEEQEEMVDGNSLEGLSSIVLNQLGS